MVVWRETSGEDIHPASRAATRGLEQIFGVKRGPLTSTTRLTPVAYHLRWKVHDIADTLTKFKRKPYSTLPEPDVPFIPSQGPGTPF